MDVDNPNPNHALEMAVQTIDEWLRKQTNGEPEKIPRVFSAMRSIQSFIDQPLFEDCCFNTSCQKTLTKETAYTWGGENYCLQCAGDLVFH